MKNIALYPLPLALTLSLLIALSWSSEGFAATSQALTFSPLARAQQIHDDLLALDAHVDIEIPGQPSSYVGPDGLSKVAPEKMRAGGLDAAVMAVAVGPKPRTSQGYAEAKQIAEAELTAVDRLIADPDHQMVLARSAEQLLDAHADGKKALILGLQNALIFGQDAGAVDQYFDRGVRVFALTHMGHNDFADSSRPLFDADLGSREPDAEHGGLSDLGRAAIGRVNALGGIVDISQLSKQAALEVMALSSAPVIASHSNVRALTQVSRNLSNEEIDRIGETGGVIHVAPFAGYLFDSKDPKIDAEIKTIRRAAGIDETYLYPFELYWEIQDPVVKAAFLSGIRGLLGPINLDTMLDHVDYIAKRIGTEHIGIGTDFNHGSGIEGFQDASEAFNVTKGLIERGYSDADIAKIWGGNFIRVWRKAEQARTAGASEV
jgi:membrane dipeptidase